MKKCDQMQVFLVVLALMLPFGAARAALPVAPAPLERTGVERVKTEMVVTRQKSKGGECDKVVFRSGSKMLQVSGIHGKHIGSYYITKTVRYGVLYLDDGRDPVATFVLSCGHEWDIDATEPGDGMTIDRERNAVTWTRTYKLPDGSDAMSSYTVSILPDGCLAVDFDFGVDEDRAASFEKRLPFACRLALEEYEDGTRAFGFGESVRTCVSDAAIEAKNRKYLATPVGRLATPVFNFELRDPVRNWSLAFPSVDVAERFAWDENHTEVKDGKRMRRVGVRDSEFGSLQKGNPRRRPTKGRFIFDLGKSSVMKTAAFPSVGGIDFWKNDALHVPVRPTRNQLVNGSFEQGLKGWHWEDWGAQWSPAEKPHEEVVAGGRVGGHALLLRANMPKAPSLCSQSMSLTPEKPHVLSFYAKHDRDKTVLFDVKVQSPARSGRYYSNSKGGRAFKPVAVKPGDWQRFEIPFTPDKGGIYVNFSAPGWNDGTEMMIDGIQVEQAEKATDFVDDPFQAILRTSRYPYNDLRPGDDYALALDIAAQEGAKGSVRVRIENFYSEVKYDRTFALDGPAKLPLAVDPAALGKGIFVVRLDYVIPTLSWTDYARFSVLSPLANKHATAQFYANHPMWFVRSTRLHDIMRKFVEWGWGSFANAHGEITADKFPWNKQLRELGIRNYIHELSGEIENGGTGILHRPEFASIAKVYPKGWSGYRYWKEITPEALSFIEKAAYQVGLEADPKDDLFAFAGEEEGWVRDVIGWEAHWSCVEAMMKGVKRAFSERGLPRPRFISSQGISHYFAGRNYDAIDGFLGTAAKYGVKYDAVAIHPYSNIDTGILGPHDADKETQHLIDQMKSHGYDETTPIYFAECFNMMPWRIPAWGCDGWGDNFRRNKAPTQARGVRECTMAGSQARLYLLALKFWPQVRLVHAWNCEPFLDVDLAPLSHVLAANTLGNLLPDPEYVGGAQPYGDVRGLCFRRKDKGDCLLAVWTTNHEVEYGERKSPVLEMALPDDVRFVDFECNERVPSEKQTVTDASGARRYLVPLTPAPLFILSKDAEGLLKGIREAVADDPSMAFTVDVKPDLAGALNLRLENLTTLRRTGELQAGGKRVPYDVPARGTVTIPLAKGTKEAMRPQSWTGDISPMCKKPWNVTWFRIPKCGEKPDWSKVPAMPFTACEGKVRKPDFAGRCQYAWNRDYLFLRVEVDDDEFVPAAEDGKTFSPAGLWDHDGSVEIYFDGFGDARSQGEKGYDDNDSRYDVLENRVHRQKAVNIQLAQGPSSATEGEIREKLIRSFARTEKGYVYEVAFAARYMAPVELKPGSVFGTGVAVHDFTKDAKGKWQCTTVSSGVDPDRDLNDKPYLMPLAILTDEE